MSLYHATYTTRDLTLREQRRREEELRRHEALRMAIEHAGGNYNAEFVVKSAQQFETYLHGQEKENGTEHQPHPED